MSTKKGDEMVNISDYSEANITKLLKEGVSSDSLDELNDKLKNKFSDNEKFKEYVKNALNFKSLLLDFQMLYQEAKNEEAFNRLRYIGKRLNALRKSVTLYNPDDEVYVSAEDSFYFISFFAIWELLFSDDEVCRDLVDKYKLWNFNYDSKVVKNSETADVCTKLLKKNNAQDCFMNFEIFYELLSTVYYASGIDGLKKYLNIDNMLMENSLFHNLDLFGLCAGCKDGADEKLDIEGNINAIIKLTSDDSYFSFLAQEDINTILTEYLKVYDCNWLNYIAADEEDLINIFESNISHKTKIYRLRTKLLHDNISGRQRTLDDDEI